jgi:hypothetical protein
MSEHARDDQELDLLNAFSAVSSWIHRLSANMAALELADLCA